MRVLIVEDRPHPRRSPRRDLGLAPRPAGGLVVTVRLPGTPWWTPWQVPRKAP